MPAVGFYCNKGLMTKAGSLDELASKMSATVSDLQASFMSYNENLSNRESKQRQDEFGKTTFPAAVCVGVDEPVYIEQVTPAVHYCMGGLKFTVNAEVVGQDGSILPGMFAAGEVTGGLHGRNRLAGCSLLDCVVYGRRAGSSAAKYVLAFTSWRSL